MNIHRIIVHEVQKEPNRKDTKLVLSDQLILLSAESKRLVTELSKSYTSDKITYGIFNLEPSSYFPDRFNQYNSILSYEDETFIDLTRDQISGIKTFISQKNFAKGGYFLFTEYESNGTEFYAIFLLRDTAGNTLRRVGSTFEVNSVEYLDTNHLAMAFRLNVPNFNKKEGNYISFTNRKQPDVSEYFTDWVCATKLESSTDFTKKLYDIINEIPLPKNPKTGKEYSIDEVRNMVYDHAKSNGQKNINLKSLSEHIYGDEGIIQDFATNNDIEIDTEFRFDRNVLKKFIQLSISVDGIRLNFSRNDLGTKVRRSEDNPNAIIIESELFVNKFKVESESNV
ncbi:nucleoid-associated protein [Lunatibacter salilacus]|uniref:nucleoid-associated protein n=1 Tax=Lunatibacter salilacus TaxID=2483804 RepID=UPI00131B9E1A|nr:nucleoid-associated protein [Lunatibacter salilacus]